MSSDYKQLLQDAYLEIRKLRGQLADSKKDREPIAIVGMACRYPGGVDSPQKYWELLRDGLDAISEVPAERWNIDHYYHPDVNKAGTIYTRAGGFISNVDQFDADFFGISPREAIGMDPQQRLLLEITWEALEHAGQPINKLNGSKTGVFLGMSTDDYAQLGVFSKDPTQVNAYNLLGAARSVAAGRLAYTLGLQGPTLQLDTACSSSLLAVHLACQSLRQQECDMALAGGINLILSPEISIGLCRLSALAPDGRCKTFDAAANGYVRGEGAGMIVLKRLSAALAANDNILAVITGSAVNHDGHSNGLTAPNGSAQEALLRQALANAAIEPAEVQYVEAHGTGTVLGDPIEVQALLNVLGAGRTDHKSLAIGSVKTNFGHLEAAAGIAGLMKVVLALQQQQIPPHLHLRQLNPYINWQALPVRIPSQLEAWSPDDKPRIAGVSAFGMSGTNVHAVLQQAPGFEVKINETERPLHIMTFTAKTKPALAELVSRYGQHLADYPQHTLADMAFSTNTGRSHFQERFSIVAATKADLTAKLAQFTLAALTNRIQPAAAKVGFMFTGQGAQYPGMGQALYQTQPVFKTALDQCATLLDQYLTIPLLTVLWSQEPAIQAQIHQTQFTQPALFALEYALAQLWLSWGVKPDYLIGHSVGEFVAATLAGVITLEDGLSLIAARGRLMQALPAGGSMGIVLAALEVVQRVINTQQFSLDIAAINAPEQIVIAGKQETVDQVLKIVGEMGYKTQSLQVSHAFHSSLMEPMLAEFRQIASKINYAAPKITLISNLTGKPIEANTINAEYWVQHIRQAVQFNLGMQTLHEMGCRTFIELGPQPVLIGLAKQCIQQAGDCLWLPSLRKGKEAWETLLTSLETLYSQGYELDWQGFDAPYHRRKVVLPSYPFQRQRYWLSDVKLPEPSKSLINTATATELSDWFYQLTWQAMPLAQAIPKPVKRLWLIFSNDQEICQALVQRLQETNPCLIISSGERLTTLSDQHYLINPSNKDDFTQLFDQLKQSKIDITEASLIYLWGYHGSDSQPFSSTDLESLQQKSCGGLLHLAQALLQLQLLLPLTIVTCQAQPITGSNINIAQAPLLGLAKAINLEHPQLPCFCIDIDSSFSIAQAVAIITEELHADRQEQQIAWRKQARLAPRVSQSPAANEESSSFKIYTDKTYLVTGGLGGLGLQVAQWLAMQGARSLLLIGRNKPAAAAEKVIKTLQAQGVQIRTLQVDVAKLTEVEKLFTNDHGLPPLTGIIHAAGTDDRGPLLEQNWQRFEQVFAAKVIGAWHLHTCSLKLNLEMFVLFSSIASFFGSVRQGPYVAANAFLDSLAHYRNQRGLSAQVINWGPWADIGMAARAGATSYQNELIKPQQGLAAFEHVLAANISQTAIVSPGYIEFMLRQLPQPRPSWLSGLQEKSTALSKQSAIFAHTAQMSKEQRYSWWRTTVHQHLCQVLGRPENAAIDAEQVFLELGMDSLMAVELKDRLQRVLGEAHTLATTVAYDYPSIAALADYLNKLTEDQSPQLIEKATQPPVKSTTQKHDIAIIGIAGQFPGADDVETFWQNLVQGKNSIQEVPTNRWEVERWYTENGELPNKTYSKWGGFINQPEQFDPAFFNISPIEAEFMDPQQRLFLQTAWHAFEDAGLTEKQLAQAACGVYVGVKDSHYLSGIATDKITGLYPFVGNTLGILAARISYYLNLKGPSLALDTECSSALTALHLACESLQNGSNDLALVGGISLLLNPFIYVLLSQAKVLSLHGQCLPFDNRADGIALGEAVGAVVLKRLDKAMADNDRIYAVIKATATNQDGKTNGITAPNSLAQTALALELYRKANVDPASITYIEAHGTGTRLGDPIEISALTEAFQTYQAQYGSCAIGSVKANVGHCMAAAGIVGLIKLIKMFQHKQLPPLVNFIAANEHIDFSKSPFFINTQCQAWSGHAAQPRRAAISAYGTSGTNCQALLEEVPAYAVRAASSEEPSYYLVTLSAKTIIALQQKIILLKDWLQEESNTHPLADISYTLNARRSHFAYRFAVVVKNKLELVQQLASWLETAKASNSFTNIKQNPLESFKNTTYLNAALPSVSDAQAYQQTLLQLAVHYTEGGQLDWEALYANQLGACITLPQYPFAKELYWLAKSAEPWDTSARQTVLHPLLDQNISTFDQQVFIKKFTHADKLLTDHQIAGHKTLPGVAYLEMARIATKFSLNAPYQIKSFIWAKPILLQESQVQVHIKLSRVEHTIRAEFVTQNNGEQAVHAQGNLEPLALQPEIPAVHDITAIKNRCRLTKTPASIYKTYQQQGAVYGASLQIIKELHYNQDEALAKLVLPDNWQDDFTTYELHPAIMDGALQSIIGLANASFNHGLTYVPVAVGEIYVIKPLSKTCYSYITRCLQNENANHANKFIVLILDEHGNVLIKINELTIRAISYRLPTAQLSRELNYYFPQWQRTPLLAKLDGLPKLLLHLSAGGQLVIFDNNDELFQTINHYNPAHPQSIILVKAGAQFQQLSSTYFIIDPVNDRHYQKLFNEIIKDKYSPLHMIYAWDTNSQKLDLELTYANKVAFIKEQLNNSIIPIFIMSKLLMTLSLQAAIKLIYLIKSDKKLSSCAISAFMKTLALENPKFAFACVNFAANEQLTPEQKLSFILSELNAEQEKAYEIAYQDSERWVKTLHQVEDL